MNSSPSTAKVRESGASQGLPKWQLWTGRVISGACALFFLSDAAFKLLRLQAAVEGTTQVGYPEWIVFPLGIVLFVCTVVYVIPRTSFIGAILLTGYLGGATATHARMGQGVFVFPVLFGVLVWVGLCLRRERLRAVVFSRE